MARFETWVISDLKEPLNVTQLHGEFFSADAGANLIGVEVLNGGTAASLSGTVTGYIVRADGGTVTQGGTLNNNKASVILPAAAYNVEGIIDISIKLTTSGVVTTLASMRGCVHRATTDTIVDPGTVITMVGSVNGVQPDPTTGDVTLEASDITSGTFAAARIPNLNASKITAGTLGAARLPDMVGATSSNNGTKGAVPAPSAGDQGKFLTGAGTWVDGVQKAGDTMTGDLTAPNVVVKGASNPSFYIKNSSGGSIARIVQRSTTGLRFRVFKNPGSDDIYEDFYLPYATAESTDSHEIITGKGGTINGQLMMHATQLYFENANNVPVFRLQYANNRPYFQAYKVGESSTEGYTNYRLPESTGDSATYEILTTKTFDPYYKANDTFSTLDLMPCAGYVTGSTKRIYFSVPVDKSMGNISSIAVNALSGTIRTPEGEYIGGSSSSVNWLTGNTVTAIKVSEYVARVLIAFETAPTNAVNNTPISGALNVTLKFS